MVLSSQCLPISINPIGRPSDWPHGRLMAGCPVASNGAVLAIISKARWIESSRGASAGGSGVASDRKAVGLATRQAHGWMSGRVERRGVGDHLEGALDRELPWRIGRRQRRGL